VEGGKVIVANTGATKSATGSNALELKSGTELSGCGYIGNSRLYIRGGALFTPGLYNTGTLKVASAVTLDKDGVIAWRLDGNGKTVTLEEVKSMTLNGTLKVTLKGGYTPQLGDSFSLWNCKKVQDASVPTLELPELPEGLAWDTTELLTTTGTLRVMDASGLHLTSWDEPVKATVYTLDGMQVDAFDCIYNKVKDNLNKTNLPAVLYILKLDGLNGSGAVKMRKE
jgi:hypothetical protein